MFCYGHTKFEMPVSHLNGDVGCIRLTGKTKVGHVNLVSV